jgi:hypothetical protein
MSADISRAGHCKVLARTPVATPFHVRALGSGVVHTQIENDPRQILIVYARISALRDEIAWVLVDAETEAKSQLGAEEHVIEEEMARVLRRRGAGVGYWVTVTSSRQSNTTIIARDMCEIMHPC